MNEIHRDVATNNFLGQRNVIGPHYNFEVGDLELFQRFNLSLARRNKAFAGKIQFIDILGGCVPFFKFVDRT